MNVLLMINWKKKIPINSNFIIISVTFPCDSNSEKLYNSMINAYVHPAEKNQTVNPMQIWNDAYTYMKTNQDIKGKGKDKICREYTDIIKPMEQNN